MMIHKTTNFLSVIIGQFELSVLTMLVATSGGSRKTYMLLMRVVVVLGHPTLVSDGFQGMNRKWTLIVLF